MEESWTILRVLQWTAGYFGRKGIEQPRANAEVLLAHVLGTERIQLYLHFDKPLTADELARYRKAVQRRAAREPTQYITCKQEFWSLEFEVTPAVLIPRPETELLVERALDLVQTDSTARILDLGTGSGAIAIALASERPSARILATDRSLPALEIARRNAARHAVADRILFVAMDLFSGFRSFSSGLFDLIITNPPYIGDTELPGLAPEVLENEPRSALRGGGPQGLDTIRRILDHAPFSMRPEAGLLMEIGAGQAEVLEEELADHPVFELHELVKDYSGIKRVLHLRSKAASADRKVKNG